MVVRPVSRRTPCLVGALLNVALATGAGVGCSAAAGHPASGSPPPPAATSTATPSAKGTTTPGAIALDEHAAGTTVRVSVGHVLLVRLHSTYWSTPASSDPKVLAPLGSAGSTPTGTCPPGGGCGMSTAGFTARQPGTAHLTAQRSSCGEAMRCSPGQSSYAVTVEVTG